jgi:hypothetical protein
VEFAENQRNNPEKEYSTVVFWLIRNVYAQGWCRDTEVHADLFMNLISKYYDTLEWGVGHGDFYELVKFMTDSCGIDKGHYFIKHFKISDIVMPLITSTSTSVIKLGAVLIG